MKAHPSGPYAVLAGKRKEREEHELPDPDPSDEAKEAAVASALEKAEIGGVLA